eukprot:3053694-Alexandrium_andersonii.AAC.1
MPWQPCGAVSEGEHAACWLLEALAPRELSQVSPACSDLMLVGALALLVLDAGRSEVVSVAATLFRDLPPVESFRRACA